MAKIRDEFGDAFLKNAALLIQIEFCLCSGDYTFHEKINM